MSIQTELTRITNAKSAIKTAIEGKGVNVPDGTLLDGMASRIEAIEASGGGGGSPDAVLYTAQTLTDAQKKQARDNIDAAIADFVVNGTVNSDRTVTLDKTFAQIHEAVQDIKKDHVRLLLTMFGTTFVLPAVVISSNEIAFQAEIISVDDTLQTVKVHVTANGPTLKFNFGVSLDSNNDLPQHAMAADPTTDMQIATKQYVDNKECILKSTTQGSTKKFKITVDDSGTISATEVT